MPFVFEADPITSRQNRRIVALCKLSDRKARESTATFRFDGVKLLCEALRRGVSLSAVFVRAGSAQDICDRMSELGGCTPADIHAPVYAVEDSLFEKISEENAPEGVICVAKYIDKCHKKYTINSDGFLTGAGGDPTGNTMPVPDGSVLLLESVRDPGNVGAVIRSAAALGVGAVILSDDCADLYHPRTLRAAMGTLFTMPVLRVNDLVGAVRALQRAGRTVSAAALDESAVRLGEVPLSHDPHVPPCAVIGNEGHGLSRAVIDVCDRTVYIPMEAGTESLNAGVAAALIMWEMRKDPARTVCS